MALYDALDAQRVERGLSWAAAVDEINSISPSLRARLGEDDHPIASSTVANMRKRGAIPCQHALALLQWLDRTPESFVPGSPLDSAAARLPDVGPDRRLRWDIAALAEAVEARRLERGLTWAQVAGEVGCSVSQVSTLRTRAYGIDMALAMRITHWLGRPAAGFTVAALR